MGTEEPKQLALDKQAKIEASRTISDAKLIDGGAYYKIDEQSGKKRLIVTNEQIKKIQEKVEKILKQGILSQENLNNGSLDIIFEENESLMDYEFELEKEQRINVNPENLEIKKWENHVTDTYDQSGRCRIREKNSQPRISIKVPLLSKDTERSKCCIRLEFKPLTEKQREDILKIRELILLEPGTETHEKWGTPLELTNGEGVWINKDDKGNHWIETDESEKIEDLLPEGLTYLKHSKSKIKI